jgi:hypothetical protein
MSAGLGCGSAVTLFADLEQAVWGVAIAGPQACLAVGTLADREEVAFEPASIEGAAGDPDWLLSSDRGTVRISAGVADGVIELATGEGAPATGRAAGTLQIGGREHRLDAGALRCSELPGGRLDSIRLVGTWFPAPYGLALLAGRPEGAAGQDRDQIEATVLGEDQELKLFEPRLSTTYDGDGAVSRMGIELWLGESEEGEQTSRRVAGERSGSRAVATVAGARVEALGMRCHGRGEDGAGVYLLLRQA